MENNLINVQIEERDGLGLVVSSRVIAQGLGKRHADVLESIDKILENGDYRSLCIPTTYKVEGQKREYKEYLLTKDGFTLYMFNIQGYNDFKLAYINKFNEMAEQLKANTPQLSLKNQIYIDIIGAESEVETALAIRRLEHEVIRPLEDKAEYFDELVDKDLHTNFRDTAKEFGMRQTDFIEWLLEKSYVYRDQKGNLKPTAKSMNEEYMALKESINRHNGLAIVQTLITAKGRAAFRRFLKLK